MFTNKKTFVLMSFHVRFVVITIINRACTHTSSIAVCMVACIEADNCAINTCTKTSHFCCSWWCIAQSLNYLCSQLVTTHQFLHYKDFFHLTRWEYYLIKFGRQWSIPIHTLFSLQTIIACLL